MWSCVMQYHTVYTPADSRIKARLNQAYDHGLALVCHVSKCVLVSECKAHFEFFQSLKKNKTCYLYEA